MGRYLDLARAAITAPISLPEPECGYEINEIYEKTPGDGAKASLITRAVLVEAPEGVPDSWVQGVADLLAAPPHPAWTAASWATLQGDALAFLRTWAAQARRLGWDALDLFAVHPAAPVARMDGMGLVPLLSGRPVAALAEDSAVIRTASGGTLTYRRHRSPPAGRCMIWGLLA